jgi:hypothetical protein
VRETRALGNGARLAILTVGIGALVSLCRPARAAVPAIDYESVFAKTFPLLGDEHAITDWTLYQALVTGDVVTYALRVDPMSAAEMDGSRGRAYQTQQLEGRLKQDRRLVAAFDGQRKRLQSMVVSTVAPTLRRARARSPTSRMNFDWSLAKAPKVAIRCRMPRSRQGVLNRSMRAFR